MTAANNQSTQEPSLMCDPNKLAASMPYDPSEMAPAFPAETVRAHYSPTPPWEGSTKVAKVASQVASDKRINTINASSYAQVAKVAKVASRNTKNTFLEQELLPLRNEPTKQNPYPVECLGIFADAVRDLCTAIKVPEAMAASSVLTALAFCTQGFANVKMHDGRNIPLSLNCMTVGDSGDRKTALDSVVSQVISNIEREEYAHYQKENQAYLQAKEAYEKKPKKEKELFPFEQEAPKNPAMVLENINAEGLFRALKEGRPSVAVFSDEGGLLFGGNAFQKENALKSITFFSKLWDGSPVDKARAGEGFSRLYDRRVSMHLMVQPTIAEKILSDDMYQGQGFLPRFLMSWPKSLKGTRTYENINARNSVHVKAFYSTCEKLLRTPLQIDENGSLCFAPIQLDAQAHQYWIANHDNIEKMLFENGPLCSIAPYASKSAEQAIRIAGILTLAENHHAQYITGDTMKNAIILTRWYLAEVLRVSENKVAPKDIIEAEELLQWLDSKNIQKLSLRLIMRRGPNAFRLKRKAEDLIATLEEHGQIVRGLGSEMIDGQDSKTFWERVAC